jgi:hypothetical protein
MDRVHWIAMAGFTERAGRLAHQIHALRALGYIRTLAQILTALSGDRDLEMLMPDSTVVRAHQHAAGAQKKSRKRMVARAAD